MKPINTSSSFFERFITEGYLYVDKTAHIHRLITDANSQFFLARPRRFGKSLLVSTLKAIFEGRRELFAGLAIDKLPWDWKVHPVIHLNMGSCSGSDLNELREAVRYQLDAQAREHDLKLVGEALAVRFQDLISQLSARGPVVILVDEYDKPILGHLGQKSVVEVQKFLKNFYGVIKTTEAHQRFALITGISKFSKVSIFSDLNNLTDLSMEQKSATLLGYTQEELEANFDEYIEALAKKESVSRPEILSWLKSRYNGYRFEECSPTVYNPVSVMKCLSDLKFKNYWFETATPSFLIDLLKRQPVIPEDLTLDELAFAAYDPENLEVLPLLVQTGYLTILKMEQRGQRKIYTLGYPNGEIEDSLSHVIAKAFAKISDMQMSSTLQGLMKALDKGDVPLLMRHLRVFFAGIPYDIQLDNEKYYQSLFYAIFRVLGAEIEAECRTSDGRVDAILKTPERIFVLEFKLFDTAQAALEQIHAKDYGLAWADDGREILLVGVSFDGKTRNIGEWVVG